MLHLTARLTNMVCPFVGDIVAQNFGGADKPINGLVTYVDKLTGYVDILWEDKLRTYKTPCESLALVSRLESKV